VNFHLSDADFATLRRLEEVLWIAETRYDNDYMNRIFAADFFEFGRSGRVWSHAEMLGFRSGPKIDVVIPLLDFTARALSDDVAQVTYNSAVTYDGVVQYARRSSIWSRTNTTIGWQLRFHQGTPFQPT
jgi:hypothetical protein